MQLVFIYFVTTLVGFVFTGILLPTRSEKESECSLSDEANLKKLFHLFKDVRSISIYLFPLYPKTGSNDYAMC